MAAMRSSILHGLFAIGGVARSGRRMMSTMSSSPWLMLPPGRGSSGDILYNFYSLTEERHVSFGGGFEFEDGTRFVGSSHGWLALFNARTNHLFLTNPVSRRRIDLPPIHTLPDPEINLRHGVSKLVLSCSPDDGDDWRAVMAFGPGNRLAFSPGGTAWRPMGRVFHNYGHAEERFARVYDDFVYWPAGRSFICVPEFEYDFDNERRVHCTEYWFAGDNDPKLVTSRHYSCEGNTTLREIGIRERRMIDDEDIIIECRMIGRMIGGCVVHAEQLFYLVRCVLERVGPDGEQVLFEERVGDIYPYKTIKFVVFKVENGHERMRRVKSLDGLAVFVGINHSFAVSAADFPNIKPDSIYFTDGDINRGLSSPHSTYGGHDIGVFDVRNQTVSPFYYPSTQTQRIHPPPLWFTPTPH